MRIKIPTEPVDCTRWSPGLEGAISAGQLLIGSFGDLEGLCCDGPQDTTLSDLSVLYTEMKSKNSVSG